MTHEPRAPGSAMSSYTAARIFVDLSQRPYREGDTKAAIEIAVEDPPMNLLGAGAPPAQDESARKPAAPSAVLAVIWTALLSLLGAILLAISKPILESFGKSLAKGVGSEERGEAPGQKLHLRKEIGPAAPDAS